MPYGPVGRLRPGRRYRVQPGSLTYDDTVLLLRDHDQSQRLGRTLTLTEAPGRLHVLLLVNPGRAGDRALAAAAAGELGLSPGMTLLAAEPDPLNPGVVLIVAALLHEVSLTTDPAWR